MEGRQPTWDMVSTQQAVAGSWQLAAWQRNVIMCVLYYQERYVLYLFIDYLHNIRTFVQRY